MLRRVGRVFEAHAPSSHPAWASKTRPTLQDKGRAMWYAAHIITVFRYRKRRQRKFHVWENIVLIEAASSDEAWEKAKSLGREDAAHDDPSLTIGGIPARLE